MAPLAVTGAAHPRMRQDGLPGGKQPVQSPCGRRSPTPRHMYDTHRASDLCAVCPMFQRAVSVGARAHLFSAQRLDGLPRPRLQGPHVYQRGRGEGPQPPPHQGKETWRPYVLRGVGCSHYTYTELADPKWAISMLICHTHGGVPLAYGGILLRGDPGPFFVERPIMWLCILGS